MTTTAIPNSARCRRRTSSTKCPGKLLDSGKRAEPDVTAGDTVLFGKYSGTEVKVDGVELLIMRENDILAKL